jgi:hypothetical protein
MYYIKRQGKILGPLSVGKLKEMAGSGMISEDSSISVDKIEWLTAVEVDEIYPRKPKKIITSPQGSVEEIRPQRIAVRQPDPLPVTTQDYNESALAIGEKSTPPQNTYQSYIQKPAQDCRESKTVPEIKNNDNCEINFFSILWDQVGGLPAIYKKYGDERSLKIGLIFAAVTLACFYLGFRNLNPLGMTGSTASDAKLGDILKGLCLASTPFLSLALSSMFVRNFFGDKKNGGFGGDVLIAGTAFLPIALVFLLGTHIFGMKLDSLGERETIIFLVGMGLYVETSTILLLFGGCTRISGIKENIMSIVIPVMIILSGAATYLIFKEFIKNQ